MSVVNHFGHVAFQNNQFYEQVDTPYQQCEYLLSRGLRAGQLCTKPGAFRTRAYGYVPACREHQDAFCREQWQSRVDRVMLLLHQMEQEDDEVQERHAELAHSVTPEVTLESIPKLVDATTECTVCLESESLLSMSCRHVVCYSCYQRLETKNCPVCREKIDRKFIRRL